MVENTNFTKEKLEKQLGNAVFGAIKSSIPPFVVEMLGGEDFFKKMQEGFKDNGGQLLNALVDVPDRHATGAEAVNSPSARAAGHTPELAESVTR